MLHEIGLLSYDSNELKDTIQEMIAAGSRYRNIEKELGLGIVFVLGTEVPESSYAETDVPKLYSTF